MRTVVWLRLAFLAAALVGVLQGCSFTRKVTPAPRDALAEVAQLIGVAPRVMGTDTNPFGTILFYDYQKGDQCGFGYDFTAWDGGSNSGGSGVGLCTANAKLLDCQGSSSGFAAPGNGPRSLFYGHNRDGKAVRVTMKLPGSDKTVDARLVGQAWYVMVAQKLDGKGPLEIKAFDEAGKLLHTAS